MERSINTDYGLLEYLEQGAIFNFEQGMKEKKITELVLVCNQRNK